ncbi:Rpn family recombination-promoting nuclease/putative transposase [Leptospira borgpetersenii]|uniref:Rpn family recombination-promoting nuclease/putative transposase n=1 Tax=Leptospira borgpetersenii TaxID=174 RepID=UPI000772E71B|nr:Rpn family recombination-promoting nuclease/putative transposase [Leptospira borgpetersenii]MBE8400240.1 Rpn family recombination-promoting nuclease/putative transposase [Leptospira borgpetersenii serovar Tarassovi]MBE8404115.1 Rpn family recombination-promoting nuclease/putative transposase [Leptospira borgpetersenii serovar Tarassovi]MBE8406858.1 Rpn family recombination-promoting nuclease/putative transposase [Leptospira borgpetersenii serovar Tarassovi]MBE8413537.1 Rpn family recombinati
MTEVNNPHDRLIRETFQDKKEAATFFKNTLPPEVVELLDLENLELTESSFVSEEQEQTDLLFQIPLKSGSKSNIYLLFEHKSYLENSIYIQLLGYLTEIYRNQQRSGEPLSVVIPFVFYHGEKEWKLGDRFSDQFVLTKQETEILKDFIPDFRIDLFDLKGIELKKKLESITFQVTLGVVQRIREGDLEFVSHLPGLFSLLLGIEEESKRVAILRKLLLYIYWARDLKPTELKRVLERSKLEQYEELTMTTAERLISEGIQQGKIEGKIETARNMLSEDIQLEAVLRITGLSKQDLKDHGVI